MARKLRAVGEDEPAEEPAEKPPASITKAADSSERALLVALRSHLAREMDKGAVPAHALASVSAKIREYDRDIRAIDARGEEAGPGDVPDAKFDAAAI